MSVPPINILDPRWTQGSKDGGYRSGRAGAQRSAVYQPVVPGTRGHLRVGTAALRPPRPRPSEVCRPLASRFSLPPLPPRLRRPRWGRAGPHGLPFGVLELCPPNHAARSAGGSGPASARRVSNSQPMLVGDGASPLCPRRRARGSSRPERFRAKGAALLPRPGRPAGTPPRRPETPPRLSFVSASRGRGHADTCLGGAGVCARARAPARPLPRLPSPKNPVVTSPYQGAQTPNSDEMKRKPIAGLEVGETARLCVRPPPPPPPSREP